MSNIDFRKLAENFSFLVIGEVISKIFTFAAFAFLARAFGPIEFGHLEFVLAVMIFAMLFVDFGANPYGSREIAKAQQRIGEIVASLVGMRAILVIIAYGLLYGFSLFFFSHSPQLRRLTLLYGLSLFFIPFFLQFVFQGLEKMKWVAISSVIRQMVFAVGVFVVVMNIKRLWVVPCIEITAVFSLSLYCIYMLIFHVNTTGFKTNIEMIWSTFKEALPIGLSDITWAFMWYFATILLGLMTSGKEVGLFSAAFRPVMTLHTFVWLYFCNLLPSISRSVLEPKDVLDNLMHHSMTFLSWGTVFIGVIGLTMAEPLMILVFGNQFRESSAVIKILIWMIPLSSLGCHYRYSLIGYGYQKYEFIAQAAAAAVSVIMGFILIPIYAEIGAALSLVIAVSVNCLIVYVFVKKNIHHIPFLTRVIKPLLGGAGMVGLFFAVSSYNLWLAIIVSVVFYILAMMILQPEIRKILSLIISKQDGTKIGDLTLP